MTYELTFSCSEPGCGETVVLLCEAKPGETDKQLRQRDPVFLDALCGAKHSRNYGAASAIEIEPEPLAAKAVGEL